MHPRYIYSIYVAYAYLMRFSMRKCWFFFSLMLWLFPIPASLHNYSFNWKLNPWIRKFKNLGIQSNGERGFLILKVREIGWQVICAEHGKVPWSGSGHLGDSQECPSQSVRVVPCAGGQGTKHCLRNLFLWIPHLVTFRLEAVYDHRSSAVLLFFSLSFPE